VSKDAGSCPVPDDHFLDTARRTVDRGLLWRYRKLLALVVIPTFVLGVPWDILSLGTARFGRIGLAGITHFGIRT
jgi:hypothetical protein